MEAEYPKNKTLEKIDMNKYNKKNQYTNPYY